MRWALTVSLLLSTRLVLAHSAGSAHKSLGWPFDPVILVPMVISALVYALGVARLWPRITHRGSLHTWRILAFALGWLSLALALLSPLDTLADISFAAHMAQHVILAVIAPPLLILGRPIGPFMFAFPCAWRRPLGQRFFTGLPRTLWRTFTKMPVAASVHGIVVWLWHLPFTYEAALANNAVHHLEHFSLLGSALLFWWSVIYSGRQGRLGYGSGVIGLFLTAMHMKLLGILIALAPVPLYPSYAVSTSPWGLSVLEDQQLAGLIMLLPCGATYLVVGLVLMATWLAAAGRNARTSMSHEMLLKRSS